MKQCHLDWHNILCRPHFKEEDSEPESLMTSWCHWLVLWLQWGSPKGPYIKWQPWEVQWTFKSWGLRGGPWVPEGVPMKEILGAWLLSLSLCFLFPDVSALWPGCVALNRSPKQWGYLILDFETSRFKHQNKPVFTIGSLCQYVFTVTKWWLSVRAAIH